MSIKDVTNEQRKEVIKELSKGLEPDDLGEIAAYFAAVLGARKAREEVERADELVDAYHRPQRPVIVEEKLMPFTTFRVNPEYEAWQKYADYRGGVEPDFNS